jgi:DNA polymerase I-like protein with 3'-5' exonuclease and polymerase domains
MGDSTLARAMLDGEDTHQATTRMIEEMLPTTVLEDLRRRGIKPRQIGKKFNFSLLYKSGAGMLQEAILIEMNVWLELSLLEELKRAWFKLYFDIAEWHDEILSAGKATTILGRRYSYTKNSPFNTRFNYVNQATGAEVSQSAIPDIVEMCREFNDAYIVNFQHDSYIIEADEADAISIAKRFKAIAETTQHEVLCRGYYPEIQLPFEVVIGDCWGEMERGENCQTI